MPEPSRGWSRRPCERFGRLDVACNNAAGGGQAPTRMADLPIDAYDSAIAVDASQRVSLHEVRDSLPCSAPVVARSSTWRSTAGNEAVGGLAGYVSAKHGVVGLTRCAALEYAEHGVRVNALAPGPILDRDAAASRARNATARRPGRYPCGGSGGPMRSPKRRCGCALDHASFITGTTLPIDGGKLAGMAPFAGMSPDHDSAG